MRAAIRAATASMIGVMSYMVMSSFWSYPFPMLVLSLLVVVSVGVEPVLVPAQFLAEALACVGNQIPDAGRKDGRGDVRDGLPVKGCEHIRGDGCCRGYKDGPDGEHLREFEGLPLGLLLCLLALPLAPPAFQLLEQLFHMVTPSLHSSSRAWMPCCARKSFCLCLMSVA